MECCKNCGHRMARTCTNLLCPHYIEDMTDVCKYYKVPKNEKD